MRESFTDFTISRAQILVDGNFVASRTVMAGRFDKAFAFRYTDEGLLVEERVQTDTYDFLRQLGQSRARRCL